MIDRATARHRASQRALSPLSTLTGSLSIVGDHVGTIGRSGVVIAMSSGLVASMALPTHAVTKSAAESTNPQTASNPVAGGSSSSFFAAPEGGLLALPAGLVTADEPVTAPEAATVAFDHTAFVPARTRAKAFDGDQAQPKTRREARANRSTVRTGNLSQAPSQGTSSADSSDEVASAPASGSAVVSIAARYKGVPYRYGGTTARGVDCSGLVKLVFGKVGKSVPRTADAQLDASRRISRSSARPGDLVFFLSGGNAYHVGIYVGNNTMIDAGRTGSVVQQRKIWSSNVVFARP